MFPAIPNSPATAIAVPGITADDVTIPLVDASIVPDAPNIVTIGNGEDAEVIYYTGKDGNNLTGVTREYDKSGSVGAKKDWPAGTIVARRFTAYELNYMRKRMPFPVYNIEGFGAPKGISGDATAYVQAAVDSGEIDIWLPPGAWRITSPINATNRGARGIRFHGCFMGSPNSSNDYGTVIIADTGGVLFDFTGTLSYEFYNVKIQPGTVNPSTIGILAARCASWSFFGTLFNTTINMADLPTANGGVGSIAVYNCESEQMRMFNVTLRANTPMVMTAHNIYDVASPFQTINIAPSTMSHVTIGGASEFWAYNGPGCVLENIHTIYLDNVYFYKERAGVEYAIKVIGRATNFKMYGNVEAYQHLLSVEASTDPAVAGLLECPDLRPTIYGTGHLIFLAGASAIKGGTIFPANARADNTLSLFSTDGTGAVEKSLIYQPANVAFGTGVTSTGNTVL